MGGLENKREGEEGGRKGKNWGWRVGKENIFPQVASEQTLDCARPTCKGGCSLPITKSSYSRTELRTWALFVWISINIQKSNGACKKGNFLFRSNKIFITQHKQRQSILKRRKEKRTEIILSRLRVASKS